MLLDLLEGAGNLFDLPGSMVRDAVTLNNPFDQLLSPLGSQNRMSGRDVLENYGALSPNQEGLDFGDVAGGALGMAMDPLSYISGVGALKFLARGSKVDDVAKLIPKAGQAAARSATGTALVPYRNPLAEVLGMGDAQPLPTSGSVDPSAFLANAFGSSTPLALPAPAAPFYSRLRRAVEALPDKPIKSQSLLNTLKKNPEGISMDEWEWSDMPDFVSDGGVLTKQQILKHMDEWSTRVERADLAPAQITYEGPSYTKDQVLDVLRQSSGRGETFTSPLTGAKMYSPLQYVDTTRSLSKIASDMATGVTFPEAMVRYGNGNLEDLFGGRVFNKTNLEPSRYSDFKMPDGKDYLETLLQDRAPTSTANYESPHWPHHDNVAAHLRTTTRNLDDVGPVHFVDELQSDWHQQGRSEGYGIKTIDEMSSNQEIVDALLREQGMTRRELWQEIGENPMEMDIADLRKTVSQQYGLDYVGGVPDSPLKNAWQDIGLKQALYDAAAKGSPGIGWTTGEDIAELVGGVQSGQNKFYDTEIGNRLMKILGSKGQKGVTPRSVGLTKPAASPPAPIPQSAIDDPILQLLDDVPDNLLLAGSRFSGKAHYMPIDPKVRDRILAEGFPLLAVPLMAALGYGLTPGGNERL